MIHTDSMTAVQILMNSKESERSLFNYNFDTARKLDDKVINWIPSHVGIEGNELADQYAKGALQVEVVDYHVKKSHLKAQKIMKRTAMDINSEMVKNCGTWTLSYNKQLEQNQQRLILNFRGNSRKCYIKSDCRQKRMRKLKVKKKCVLTVKTRLQIELNIGALIVR